MDNIEGILPAGTTYQLEAPQAIQDEDPTTGEWIKKTYPVGTEVRILKHKMKREGSYQYVDYVVEMPDGYVMNVSSRQVHKILGIPAPKVPSLKSKK